MAIISGMEAAKVDDVKPFELPTEELATGILARQAKADKAKELYGIGASAFSFPVRDREEDYKERQNLSDEFQAEVDKRLAAVNGDWSQVDNSEIQAIAMKKSQDERVGHLITAKKHADNNEKQLRAIEADGGFALKFGADPFTQPLYDKDGKLRDLSLYSTQPKLNHTKAADDLFEKLGEDLVESVVWSYSGDVIASDAVRKSLWYDFWQKDWAQEKTNNKQIEGVIEGMIDHFIRGKEGMQYYEQMIDAKMRSGVSRSEAEMFARDECQNLIQVRGRLRASNSIKRTSDRQFNTKPVAPSEPTGPRPSSPAAPKSTSTGGGDKPPKVDIMGQYIPFTKTAEGVQMAEPTYFEHARGILSPDVSIEGLDSKYNFVDIKNVHGIGKAGVQVPNNFSNKPKSAAKNVEGTLYTVGKGNAGDATKLMGNNPTCARIFNVLSPEERYKNLMDGKPNFLPDYDKSLAMFSTDSDGNGIPVLEEKDLLKVYLAKAKTEAAGMRFSSDAEKQKYIDNRAMQMTNEFKGGSADGESGSLFNYTFNDNKGFNTYEIKPEIFEIRANINSEIDALEKKANKLPDEVKYLEILKAKSKNLSKKIDEAQELKLIANTPAHELFLTNPKYLEDPEKIGAIKKLEAERDHTRMLQQRANAAISMDWMIAHSRGMTYQQWQAVVDPTNADKGIVAQMSKFRDDYTSAVGGALATAYGLESAVGYGYESQLKDIPQNEKHIGTAVTTTMKSFFDGSFDFNEFRAWEQSTLKTNSPGKHNMVVNGGNVTIKPLTAFFMYKNGLNVIENGIVKSYSGATYDVLQYLDEIDEQYILDVNGVKTRVIDKVEGKKNAYSQHLSQNIAKKVGSDHKVLEYFKAQDLAKAEKLVTSKVFTFQDGTTEGTDKWETARNIAVSHLQASWAPENPTGNIKRMKYGGFDKEGKRVDLVEEDVNKQGEMIARVIAQYKKSHPKADEIEKSFPEIVAELSKERNGIFMGVNADIDNNSTIFNGIFRLDVENPIAGQPPTQIEIEIELPGITTEQLNTLGLDGYWVQFNRQILNTMKESGNASFELTVPWSEGSMNPISRRHHVIHTDMNINADNTGNMKVTPGSVIVFKNDDGRPLAEQLKDKKANPAGTNVIVYSSAEAAMVAFENDYMRTDKSVLSALNDIDEMAPHILKVMSDPNTSHAQKQAHLDEVYGPGLWAALTNNGTNLAVNANSINKMKADYVSMTKKSYEEENRQVFHKVTTKSGGELGVSKSSPTNDKDWTLTMNGQPISQADLISLDKEDLAKLVEMPDLKNNASLQALAKDLRDGKFEQDPKTGKRYMLEGATTLADYNMPGADEKFLMSSSDPTSGTMYKFVDNPNFSLPEQAPLFIAKTTVPAKLDKNVVTALEKIPLIPTIKKPLEISSGLRSIEDNIDAYKGNMKALTKSKHLKAYAVDISTERTATRANAYDGQGYEFLYWLKTQQGQSWLETNKMYAYHHNTGTGWHIHLEYRENHSGNRLLDDQAASRETALKQLGQTPR